MIDTCCKYCKIVTDRKEGRISNGTKEKKLEKEYRHEEERCSIVSRYNFSCISGGSSQYSISFNTFYDSFNWLIGKNNSKCLIFITLLMLTFNIRASEFHDNLMIHHVMRQMTSYKSSRFFDPAGCEVYELVNIMSEKEQPRFIGLSEEAFELLMRHQWVNYLGEFDYEKLDAWKYVKMCNEKAKHEEW